jgi:hypothetical protein
MKRIFLITLVVGLLAGQASAALYEIDAPLARQFTAVGGSPGDDFQTYLVIDNPGTAGSTIYYQAPFPHNFPAYGTSMKYAVGFLGELGDLTGDNLAHVAIGKASPGLSGVYDGFSIALANDDDDTWNVRVFAYSGSTLYESPWTTLTGHTATLAEYDFGSPTNLNTLTMIGFGVQGVFDNQNDNPTNPDYYHVSAVPIPGAFFIGLIGLGVAGVKLRRFV